MGNFYIMLSSNINIILLHTVYTKHQYNILKITCVDKINLYYAATTRINIFSANKKSTKKKSMNIGQSNLT